MDNTIDITELKTWNDTEINNISNLFRVAESSVTNLLKLGFIFDYSSLKFRAIITINDTKINITIDRDNDSHAKKYYIRFRNTSDNHLGDKFQCSNTYSLYYGIDTDSDETYLKPLIVYLNKFYHLNTKEKESFKEFVVKEKEKDTDNN